MPLNQIPGFEAGAAQAVPLQRIAEPEDHTGHYVLLASRENAGLTIRALSEKTGLSTATIQHAEARKPIRMTTLKKIAEACNVSVEELQG